MKTIEQIVEYHALHTEGGLTEAKKKMLREYIERNDKENHRDFSEADYGIDKEIKYEIHES